MFCPRCHFYAENGEKTCPLCGLKLIPVPKLSDLGRKPSPDSVYIAADDPYYNPGEPDEKDKER